MREGVLSLDPKARTGSGSGYGTNYVPMCQALWRQTGPGLESTTSSEEVRHQENKYLILLIHESTAVIKSTVRGVTRY